MRRSHACQAGDPCRTCDDPIVEYNATSLKNGKCKTCHNLWFTAYTAKRAADGTLTGTRATRNKPALADRACWRSLRWRRVA